MDKSWCLSYREFPEVFKTPLTFYPTFNLKGLIANQNIKLCATSFALVGCIAFIKLNLWTTPKNRPWLIWLNTIPAWVHIGRTKNHSLGPGPIPRIKKRFWLHVLNIHTDTQFTICITEMSSGLIAGNPIAGLWNYDHLNQAGSCWPSWFKILRVTIIHHPSVVWNANSADLVRSPSPAHKKFEDPVTSLKIYCVPPTSRQQLKILLFEDIFRWNCQDEDRL